MVGRVIPPISNAALRAIWMDPQETRASIVAKAGCSYDTAYIRAKAMGLPSRVGLRSAFKIACDDLFRAMWRAGVSAHEMGRHYGVDQSSISRVAQRAKLPPRKAGCRSLMTLASFCEVLLAAQMADRRRVEVALIKGQQVRLHPVDLDRLFPGPVGDPMTAVSQAWLHLHGLGLSASEAARQRGLLRVSATRWAWRYGLKWAAGKAAPASDRQAA